MPCNVQDTCNRSILSVVFSAKHDICYSTVKSRDLPPKCVCPMNAMSTLRLTVLGGCQYEKFCRNVPAAKGTQSEGPEAAVAKRLGTLQQQCGWCGVLHAYLQIADAQSCHHNPRDTCKVHASARTSDTMDMSPWIHRYASPVAESVGQERLYTGDGVIGQQWPPPPPELRHPCCTCSSQPQIAKRAKHRRVCSIDIDTSCALQEKHGRPQGTQQQSI